MISVLSSGDLLLFPHSATKILYNPSLSFVAHHRNNETITINKTCGQVHKCPLYPDCENRYQNASLAVEASFSFTIFFFCVFGLLQLFVALRAELSLASAGIKTARQLSYLSYLSSELSQKNLEIEQLSERFSDWRGTEYLANASVTGLFWTNCDKQLCRQIGIGAGESLAVAQLQDFGDRKRITVSYPISVAIPFLSVNSEHTMSFVYRELGKKEATGKNANGAAANPETDRIVYVTKNGTAYHLFGDCRYISISVSAVPVTELASKRNRGGAKYYPCEYCSPAITIGGIYYVTEYGTRYHGEQNCSAVERNPEKKKESEVVQTHRLCATCAKRQEKDEDGDEDK